jgi:hypothetical protein
MPSFKWEEKNRKMLFWRFWLFQACDVWNWAVHENSRLRGAFPGSKGRQCPPLPPNLLCWPRGLRVAGRNASTRRHNDSLDWKLRQPLTTVGSSDLSQQTKMGVRMLLGDWSFLRLGTAPTCLGDKFLPSFLPSFFPSVLSPRLPLSLTPFLSFFF